MAAAPAPPAAARRLLAVPARCGPAPSGAFRGHGGAGAVPRLRGAAAVGGSPPGPAPAAAAAARPPALPAGAALGARRLPRAGRLGAALYHRPSVEVPGQVHRAARGHEEDGRPRSHRWAGGRTGPGGLPEPAGRGGSRLQPLPCPAGRIRVRGIGGGHKRRYRMIDFQRLRYEEGAPPEPFTEKVISVRYDPCRRVRGAGSGSGPGSGASRGPLLTRRGLSVQVG